MDGDLLVGLSPAQAAVVTSEAAPLAVIAGPGSGKTRALTRRVARRCRTQDIDPSHVLVLTFSRRAASELLARLGRLGLPAGARQAGVVAGTFHSVAWAELARHRADRGQEPPAILGRPGRLIGPALAAVFGREPRRAEVTAVTGELGWARRQGSGPDGYSELLRQAGRRPSIDPAVTADVWRRYDQAKRFRRVLDLDDVLEGCTRLLTEDAEAAAAARWRYRHVFVDEYQDLNPAHRRLLSGWVGGRPDVCVVGDPDQSVYGFNGSSPDLFDRVAADWPGVTVLTLADNFRSTPEVVALAGAVRPGPSQAVAGGPPGGPGSRPGCSRRPPGPLPSLRAHADDRAEADAVADAVAARRAPGRSWGAMAVLARTNERLRTMAGALERAGIPWRLRDPRPLADRAEVRGWLDALPGRAPVGDLAELLADEAPGPDRDALERAVAEFRSTAPAGTVSGLQSWLDASGVTADEAPGAGVDLATFHRAKGLEWPAVWVVGLEEGLVPLASAGDPLALAEEQRLLYVALTRAEDELSLSWAARRSGVACRPSRWLAELSQVATILAAEPDPADQRARLASLRAAVPTGGEEADPAVTARLQALLRWRRVRARAARVAPAVILPDDVVWALAGAGPATGPDIIRAAGGARPRVSRWAPELVGVLAR